jgi:hypothetical protein
MSKMRIIKNSRKSQYRNENRYQNAKKYKTAQFALFKAGREKAHASRKNSVIG